LISEVLQIFPKHLSNLLEFTLEKKILQNFPNALGKKNYNIQVGGEGNIGRYNNILRHPIFKI
jgi:hypothetical protein